MAEPQEKTRQTTPRSSRFLGCFGFSRKKKPREKPIQTSGRSKILSLSSWPMFCLSVGESRTKTVPVDNSDKAEADGKSHTTSKLIKKKSDSKLSSKPQSPTNHKPSRQNPKADHQQLALASSNQAPRERPREITRQGPEPNITLENRTLSDPKRTGSSLSGSPTVKPLTNPKTHPNLSHTVPLPVLEGSQRVRNPQNHTRINLKEHHQRKNNGLVENYDPLKGMSIIIVTLIIMLLWGRLCAILCTSAWFYFLSNSRTANDFSDKSIASSNDSDLNSEEYKKKVVLEGLLERNHKVTS